jgi:hypothetical protein
MNMSAQLVVVVVTVIGLILYLKLRTVPSPRRCIECDLDMEFDTELPWVLAGPGQSTVEAGVRLPEPRMQQYHCPRCGRQRRVSR